ncbi:MAG: hypothetical protein HQL91_13535 [Magnetococcales bacterium]|nr:hypothetical protein [Magnetococcales bacterium]
MHTHHYRVIALLDPLPSGEATARQVITLLRGSRVRELLWVTLTGEIGLGFESCHLPLLTPFQWLQRTRAQLETRLHALSEQLEMPRWEFRLLDGPANRALAELSAEWRADWIIAPAAEQARITGQDAPAWLFPPHPLTGELHLLPDPPSRLARWLKQWPKGSGTAQKNVRLTLP